MQKNAIEKMMYACKYEIKNADDFMNLIGIEKIDDLSRLCSSIAINA